MEDNSLFSPQMFVFVDEIGRKWAAVETEMDLGVGGKIGRMWRTQASVTTQLDL